MLNASTIPSPQPDGSAERVYVSPGGTPPGCTMISAEVGIDDAEEDDATAAANDDDDGEEDDKDEEDEEDEKGGEESSKSSPSRQNLPWPPFRRGGR